VVRTKGGTMKEESKMLSLCVAGWFVGLMTGVLMIVFSKVGPLIFFGSIFVMAVIYGLITESSD
jgi:cobalamin synthase